MRPIVLTLMLVLLLTGSGEAGEHECSWWDGSKEWHCKVGGQDITPIWHVQADKEKKNAVEHRYETEYLNGSLERCRVWDDKGIGQQMECTITPKAFRCEQRMREVMRKMDRLLNMPVRENTNFETLPMKEWNQVVRDCVKETP